MRRNWLLIAIGLLAAVLVIGAVACGDDDDDDDVDDVLDDDVMDDGGDDLGVLQLVAQLSEADGSGASGEADLSVNGDGILVSLIMEGLAEGAHANHLHHGTCEEQGEIHITLDQVVADDAGDGLQTTADDEQPLAHFETGHYLAVHVGDDETVGAVVACGDVVEPA